VKRLADKTSNATKMIKDLIHAIQDDTENTVRETELGTEAAMAGADLVKAVGEALERIAERVEQTTQSAREIRVSTGQQTHASSQMAGSLGQITDVSKRIEEGTHRTVGALVDLRELSRGIQDMVTEVDLE
jgi:methyl-accepting chemotaxis protein